MSKQTKFPLEKILAVTPTEYCASRGRKLSDYELRGVYSDLRFTRPDECFESFLNRIPISTEAVVNFDFRMIHQSGGGTTHGDSSGSSYLNSSSFLLGTAMIPKLRKG